MLVDVQAKAERCGRCGRRDHGGRACETIEERTARLKVEHPFGQEQVDTVDVDDPWDDRADLD